MEIKELLSSHLRDSIESQWMPTAVEDFVAMWQIPSEQMRCFRPSQVERGAPCDRWRARSYCVAWRIPSPVEVHHFRHVLSQVLQHQPWMAAHWSPMINRDDWALLLPNQHYMDFEYADISDFSLGDEEAWMSDYGQLMLSLTETPIVHRLLKLEEHQYLYLCCFWPNYLSPQAMLDWLKLLDQAWCARNHQSGPIATDWQSADQSLTANVVKLKQCLLSLDETERSSPLVSVDLQQQQQAVSPVAQQAILSLCDRHGCQPIDVLALLTALLVAEYYAPQGSLCVVGYPHDPSSLISAGRPFFIRNFPTVFSEALALSELLNIDQFIHDHQPVTNSDFGWTWGEVVQTSFSEAEGSGSSVLPTFAVSHLYVHDAKHYEGCRYRPSQTQGVCLWLVETPDVWQWQLIYDTHRFTPLQWLSRLEQLLVQIQQQDSLKALKFITNSEQRHYLQATIEPPATVIEDDLRPSYAQNDKLRILADDGLVKTEQSLVKNEDALGKNEDSTGQVLDWLYHHARLSPETVAVWSASQQLSYCQLWQLSSFWSMQLKARGAGSEQVIAVHFACGCGLFAAIVAVWLSGAAVLVLDPRWSPVRKRTLIKQTAAHLIVGEPFDSVQEEVLLLQPMSVDAVMTPLPRPLSLDGDALACVLMTLEQGDNIAGVEVSHRQLKQQIFSSCQALGWLAKANWRLLFNAEFCSEALIRQMLMVLSQGGTLVIPDEPLDHLGAWQAINLTVDPLQYESSAHPPSSSPSSLSSTAAGQLAAISSIDYVELRVSQLAYLLPWMQSQPAVLANFRQIVLLETPLPGQSLDPIVQFGRLLPKHTLLWAAYCCRESIGFLALFDYRQHLSARYASYWPIGKLLPQVEYRVINAQGRVCPWGLSGDLYLRADWLTQIYLPASSASSWVKLSTGLPDDQSALWLRTDDRVLHDHRGQLFWLGRADAEYFASGLRVQPQRLEAALRRSGRVQSLAFIRCAPLAALEPVTSLDPLTALWVIWQPRMLAANIAASRPTLIHEQKSVDDSADMAADFAGGAAADFSGGAAAGFAGGAAAGFAGGAAAGFAGEEWHQVVHALQNGCTQALFPQSALVVNEAAQVVADRMQAWFNHASLDQVRMLRRFFQRSSKEQWQILAYWQQRVFSEFLASDLIVLKDELNGEPKGEPKGEPVNPMEIDTHSDSASILSAAMTMNLNTNYIVVDSHLANLTEPYWLAALRLSWQMSAKAPALLWIEARTVDSSAIDSDLNHKTQHIEEVSSISYCECFAARNEHPDWQVQQWVKMAEQDWLQGLKHQPACLPLLSAPCNQWPLGQKLACVFWKIETPHSVHSLDANQGTGMEHENDLILLQKRLTKRLQRLAKSFGWVVGRLQYRQQTWLQVVHAGVMPDVLPQLATTWLRYLAYISDFPTLPLASLQSLPIASKTAKPTQSNQPIMQCALTLPQQELLTLLCRSEPMAHVSLGYWLDHPGALNLQRWQQTVQQWVNAFSALRTRLIIEAPGQIVNAQQCILQEQQQEVVLLSEDWTDKSQDWQAVATATQMLIDRPRQLFKSELIDFYVIQLSGHLWRLLIVAHPLVLDDRACSRLLLQMYQQYLSDADVGFVGPAANLLDVYPAFLRQQLDQQSAVTLAAAQEKDRRLWLERGLLKKRRLMATHHSPDPRPQLLPRWHFCGLLSNDQSGYRCQSFTVNEAIWLPLLHRARREGVPVAFVVKVFYGILLAQYSQEQQDGVLFEYESSRSGLFADSLGCFCRRRALWLPKHLLQSKTATVEQLLQHSKLEYDQTKRLPLDVFGSSGLVAQMGFVDAQHSYINQARDLGIVLGFSESLQQPGCVSLLAYAQAQRLTLRLHYYAQEFNPLQLLERLVGLFEQWIAGVSRLAELDFLLPEERHQQTQLWSQGNRRIAKWPPIYRLIDEQVARTPQAIAIQCGSQALTYQQVENLAAHTAHRLLQLGCQPGEVVMICACLQEFLPSALMGVLKTAACYLPVDLSANNWRDRLRHLRVRFVLTRTDRRQYYETECPELTTVMLDQLDMNRLRSFQPRPVSSKDPLYVFCRLADHSPMLITYEAVSNLVQWYCSELAIKPQDRILLCSDDFYTDQKNIFAALVSGASLVISSVRERSDSEQLLQEIDSQQINVLNITATEFYRLLTANSAQSNQTLSFLRVLVLKNKEPVEVSRLRSWLARPDNGCRVLSTYTQEMCADVIAGHWLDLQQDQDFVPLGKPVHGIQIFVMDALGRLKPTGLTGQLVVLGQSVGRPVDNSVVDANLLEIPGTGRLYYSCDLACYASPGQLRLMGKLSDASNYRSQSAKNLSAVEQNHQDSDKNNTSKNREIDSRGIESKEIESKLRSCDGVLNAKVVQLEHEWVVYLQLANKQTFAVEALRNKVQGMFCETTVPLRFVSVDQLPSDVEGDAA